MPPQPKFSLAETFLMGIACLFADLVEILIFAIGVIPVLTPLAIGFSWALNAFVFAMIRIIFFFKHAGATNRFLVGSLFEFIPVINLLPLRATTCLATIYLANHPRLESAAADIKELNIKRLVKGFTPQILPASNPAPNLPSAPLQETA